jgi:hypothetical protein
MSAATRAAGAASYSSRVTVFPRSGALTAWGNAYLDGSASLDDADLEVVGPDGPHRVVGVPGEPDPVSLSVALGRLRSVGVTALRLVLPVPGDLTGVPGPAAVNTAAIAAGQAVLTVAPVGLPSWGLVPSVAGAGATAVVRWDVVEVAASTPPHGLPTLGEADRALSETLAESTAGLQALDVARGRADVGPRLRAIDQELGRISLPASLPARAQRLVVTASRLLAVMALATATDGAAVTATDAAHRIAALRPVSRAARHALCAAASAGAEAVSWSRAERR